MAYVVVCFADNSVSEVPTNWLYEYEGDTMCWWPPPSIKNTSMLISKCVDPDKKSWNLMSVTVQKYFVSLEKARDAAANDNYISTDDQCLGKGHRKKISNTLIHSDADEERNHDKKSYRTSKNNPKVYNRKTVNVSIQDEQSDDFIENEQSIDNVLPVWPADMQSSTNNDNTVNFVTNVYQKNMKQKKSCDLSRQNSQMSESNSTSINECEDPLNTNNIGEKADLNTQQRIEAKVDTLLRTTAEIHLKLDDVSAQLANTLIQNFYTKSRRPFAEGTR
ncbi:uncharacterized protein LOC116853669 isoform X2 [Odontomachus brunneus]|uniref:uncharacterized protein LOC116853669 isoform X2 n=1 Tax=Odontomachus brunneus TaxID=486640 RepID=UPI0013F24B84|nr:uncharacterized protein LOC116853669 isoform X2 [Odontomachus brunneus]